MGDIGLPAFVGLLSAERSPARPRPFLGLRAHEATAVQDPPDRRDGRYRRPAAVVRGPARQVSGDGFRAAVQPLLGQLLTQPKNHLLGVGVDRMRAGMRTAGPRLKGGNTLGVETFDQLLHPVPGDPVVAGHLALGPALHSDRDNDQLSHRHVAPPKKRCQLCPETGANYVVQPVTLASSTVMYAFGWGLSGKRCKWPNTLSCGL